MEIIGLSAVKVFSSTYGELTLTDQSINQSISEQSHSIGIQDPGCISNLAWFVHSAIHPVGIDLPALWVFIVPRTEYYCDYPCQLHRPLKKKSYYYSCY